jgi:hypothetical protein
MRKSEIGMASQSRSIVEPLNRDGGSSPFNDATNHQSRRFIPSWFVIFRALVAAPL